MKLVSAFIVATALTYLASAIYAVLGRPPLIDINVRFQIVFYLCAFAVFVYVHDNPGVWILNMLLGVFYAFGTVASFIGYPQMWAAYWKDNPKEGSAAGQIGMALYDLVLAVVFLSLV